MHPIAAFCRRNLNALGLELYSIAYPLLPKDRRDWLFEKNVNIVPAETGVKIIDKDEESITIGKFNKDGTYSDRPFRILTTTDIHLGDTPSLRRKAMQMLANHIAQAKPDLVIFTGDIILSKFQQLDAVQFARFMEKTGVYWAIVFGNHEVHEEKGFYKWLMLDSMRRYPHCLALHGDDSLYGYGNYRIDIKNGENSLLQSLYLFDSGRDIRERYYKDYGVPDGMKGYDFLKPEQIEWYKNCVRRTEEKYRKVKSMMYFHIPLPEFEHVMKLDENGQYVPTGEAKIFYGGMYESVGCSPFNSGMFDVICELGSTQAVYCGHDHVNDFCANYKGGLLHIQPVRRIRDIHHGHELRLAGGKVDAGRDDNRDSARRQHNGRQTLQPRLSQAPRAVQRRKTGIRRKQEKIIWHQAKIISNMCSNS